MASRSRLDWSSASSMMIGRSSPDRPALRDLDCGRTRRPGLVPGRRCPFGAEIGAIPPGADGVQNLGCQGGLSFAEWEAATPAEREAAAQNRWCRIAYQGVVGWVAGRFLAEGSGPIATGLWAVKGVAAGDVLNVRGAPSGQAPIIGALSPYETGITDLGCLTPPGTTTAWCGVQIYDIDGWVAGPFIKPQS